MKVKKEFKKYTMEDIFKNIIYHTNNFGKHFKNLTTELNNVRML